MINQSWKWLHMQFLTSQEETRQNGSNSEAEAIKTFDIMTNQLNN